LRTEDDRRHARPERDEAVLEAGGRRAEQEQRLAADGVRERGERRGEEEAEAGREGEHAAGEPGLRSPTARVNQAV
jgi:hypothetical protein